MTWTVECLNANTEAELFALPKDMQARFLHIAGLLEEFGPQHVGMPHVRSLGRKLWEIRFMKKTQKTPRHAIEIALQRMKEIEP